ncbi:hypothetical protein QR680_014803 [Steinernema hermaphroditum]|uniref:ANK_REP_REGION domain-containing protein n=1 Tax=Steinernema hermaphroditum TaxID=289476 RepID=A0AA39M4I4_9BILA|nr:hypothetical protein QR680_014803 [Steinernema hermaphroditum]
MSVILLNPIKFAMERRPSVFDDPYYQQFFEVGVLEKRRPTTVDNLDHWLRKGDIGQLENLLLQGRAHLLNGKTAQNNPKTRVFLKNMEIYKQKINLMLESIYMGDVDAVADLLQYKRCIMARHPLTMGTTVHLAVIHNHVEILKTILSHPSAPINARDVEGRTPLHYAAAMAGAPGADQSAFDLLIEHGAKEHVLDVEGYAPENYKKIPLLMDLPQVEGLNKFPIDIGDDIDKLIVERNLKALQEVVYAGDYALLQNRVFPPASRDLQRVLAHLHTRIRAVHQAVSDDDLPTVKQLLDNYDIATGRDETGKTPLHLAIIFGRRRITDYILMIYPNTVDAIDKDGRTPLHYATVLPNDRLRDSLVNALMSAGANFASKDKVGQLPETYMRDRKLAKEVYQSVRSQTIDMIQGEEGDSALARTPHPNAVSGMLSDDDGDIDVGVEERVLALDFDQKDYSTLENIQIEGRGEQIWKLVKKHVHNEKLNRFLHSFRQLQNRLQQAFAAIDDNDFKKLRSLVDEDLVHARDPRGFAVIHMAVLRERHEMVEMIANGWPRYVDIADENGRAAIHYAAAQQNAIYDTLVDAGANSNVADKDGFTAVRYRNSPDRLHRPQSSVTSVSSLMLRRLSLDESMFDPDAPNEDQVEQWLAEGNITFLEQIVLEGRSHLLVDKNSINMSTSEFLQGINQYQAKIDAIHKAVEEGDVRRVKSLIDRPQLATARDRYGMTPLHKALLHGQTNTVRYLLGKYPSCVNSTDHAGRTALHYAAADPNGEHMIKVLQKSGGDAFIEDKYGHTPFYYRTHGKRLNVRTLKDNAVINQLISGQLNRPLLQDLEEDISDWIHTGNVGKLEELVLNGYADLLLGRNHQVNDNEAMGFLEVLPQYQASIQAIHKAIETGNLRAVKLLTDRKKLALCRDGRGLAPLHKAIVFGRTDIAKYLIRNYPQSVNAMDQNKRTPLHYAAALRDGGYLYKVMRKSGADPNIFDCNGRPPKYYLKYPGEINLESMRLDTKRALKEVLHNRVAPSYLESNIQQWLREGHIAKLEQLILSGCGDLLLGKSSTNPDAQVFMENVPQYLDTIENIHKAIREGDLSKVKMLMSTKKLALARDKHGCTPLHTAIIYEQTDVVRFIAGNFSAVLNAPDYNKRTAMHYAAAARDGGHYLKILSKAGADRMAVDNEGRTPDYYRRNAVIDLKHFKERDEDYEVINETLMEDAPVLESPPSPESLSVSSSALDSGRHDEEEDYDRHRFERLMQEKMNLPTSDNGLYLARTVAPVLTKALAEVLLKRPADPIGFISDWLIRYNDEDPDNLNV